MLKCVKCNNIDMYVLTNRFTSGDVCVLCQKCRIFDRYPVPIYIPEEQLERYLNAKV